MYAGVRIQPLRKRSTRSMERRNCSTLPSRHNLRVGRSEFPPRSEESPIGVRSEQADAYCLVLSGLGGMVPERTGEVPWQQFVYAVDGMV